MTETTSADIDLIQRILPHRFPFLFVDRVRDIRGSESAVGIKNITFNEPQFQGHFPKAPIMPGVIIIEAMAQTAAVMVGIALDFADKGAMVYFMSVETCKFRRKVVPGDVMEMHIVTKRGGGKVWKFHGRAMVGDELACEADFTAMIVRPEE